MAKGCRKNESITSSLSRIKISAVFKKLKMPLLFTRRTFLMNLRWKISIQMAFALRIAKRNGLKLLC